MRCSGYFIISLYVFKLDEKHFVINHCLTLELITKESWGNLHKFLKKKKRRFLSVFLGEKGQCGGWDTLNCLPEVLFVNSICGYSLCGFIFLFKWRERVVFPGQQLNQKLS